MEEYRSDAAISVLACVWLFAASSGSSAALESTHLWRRAVLCGISIGAAVSAELAASFSAAGNRDQLDRGAARVSRWVSDERLVPLSRPENRRADSGGRDVHVQRALF